MPTIKWHEYFYDDTLNERHCTLNPKEVQYKMESFVTSNFYYCTAADDY